MFSPAATQHNYVPMSPSLNHSGYPLPPNIQTHQSQPQTPNASGSPYRLPALRPSSTTDLVSGIVDKFNSLSVTDRDEEKARYERQISKLKAALERANIAREEAEEEAQGFRERLARVQEERMREREEAERTIHEYDSKYARAKERYKLMRLKNDETVHKLKAQFLEKEKGHWRNVADAQEAEQWERKLRSETQELLDFVQLERVFEAGTTLTSVPGLPEPPSRFERSASREKHFGTTTARLEPEDHAIGPVSDEEDEGEKTLVPGQRLKLERDDRAAESRPTSPGSETSDDGADRLAVRSSCDSLREVTPEGPPSMSIRPFATPAKQITRVPVDFGDVEDKENRAPVTVAEVLKTPMTMDRAAALAAIEYRRGRARSFMNAQLTPKILDLADKRDVSAPAMVTMTIGRKR